MNIQAMLKQAQKLQQDMLLEKEKLNKNNYTGQSSFVTVTLNGNKDIVSVKIDADEIKKEDIDLLEDLIVVAAKEAIKKVDKDAEEKMGKFTQGMPGLF